MQRVKDERGAVAVLVALLMVALVGAAAVAIDVSAIWAKHQQLQTGADAGALAVAQDCANGACGTPSVTAQDLAVANVHDGQATASISPADVNPSTGQVTVRTSGVQEHWFAPVLGIDHSTVGAQATATWGGPTGGTGFPLAFSVCEWNWQTGGLASTTEQTIYLTKSSSSTCTGPSGNVVPGGFGWVNPDAGSCTRASMINQLLSSDTGNTPPNNCSPADFEALVGEVALIPVFDQWEGTGGNATYRIWGYAAFRFTGYYLGGQYKTTPNPCNGNERCVTGYFTRYVDLQEAFVSGPGAPELGAAVVSLVD